MSQTLHILWLNDNPVTAELMVFMYATNALRKGWWEDVHIIVWGSTAKLLCEDAHMQKLLQEFQAEGGTVSACRACAERLDKVAALEALEGVEVLYVGEQFTHIIKGNDKLITL